MDGMSTALAIALFGLHSSKNYLLRRLNFRQRIIKIKKVRKGNAPLSCSFL
jgi:hypothetical protein